MDDIISSAGTSGGYLIVRTGPATARAYGDDTLVVSGDYVDQQTNLPMRKYTYAGGSSSFSLPTVRPGRGAPYFIAQPLLYHVNSRLLGECHAVDISFTQVQLGVDIESGTNATYPSGAYWYTEPGVYYEHSPTAWYVDPIVVDNNEETREDRPVICVGCVRHRGSALVFHGPWQPTDLVAVSSRYHPVWLTGNANEYTQSYPTTPVSGAVVRNHGAYWGGTVCGSAVRANTQRINSSGATVTYTQPPHNNWGDFVVNGDNRYVVSGSRYFHTCGTYTSSSYTTPAYDESNTNVPAILYQAPPTGQSPADDNRWRLFSAGSTYRLSSGAVQSVDCVAIPYYPLAGIPHLPAVISNGAIADYSLSNYTNFVSARDPRVVVASGGAAYFQQRWSFTPRVFTDSTRATNPYAHAEVQHEIVYDSSDVVRRITSNKQNSNYSSSSQGSGGELVITGGQASFDYTDSTWGGVVYQNQPDSPRVHVEQATATAVNGGVLGAWQYTTCNDQTTEWTADAQGRLGWYTKQHSSVWQTTQRCAVITEYFTGWYYTWDGGTTATYRTSVCDTDGGCYPAHEEHVSPWGDPIYSTCDNGVPKFCLIGDAGLTTDWAFGGRTLSQDYHASIPVPADEETGCTAGVETTDISVTAEFYGVLAQKTTVSGAAITPPTVTAVIESGAVVVNVSWSGQVSTFHGSTGTCEFAAESGGQTVWCTNTGQAGSSRMTVTWEFRTSTTQGQQSIDSRMSHDLVGDTETDTNTLEYTNRGGVTLALDNCAPTFPTLFSGYSGYITYFPSGATTLRYTNMSRAVADVDAVHSQYLEAPTPTGPNIFQYKETTSKLTTTSIGLENSINTVGTDVNGVDDYNAAVVTGRKAYKDGGPTPDPAWLGINTVPATTTTELIQCGGCFVGGPSATINSPTGSLYTVYKNVDKYYSSSTGDPETSTDDSNKYTTSNRGAFTSDVYTAFFMQPTYAFDPVRISGAYLPCPWTTSDAYPRTITCVSAVNSWSIDADASLSVRKWNLNPRTLITEITEDMSFSAVLSSSFSSGGGLTCSMEVSAYLQSGARVLYNSRMYREVPCVSVAAVIAMLNSGAQIYNQGEAAIQTVLNRWTAVSGAYIQRLDREIPADAAVNTENEGDVTFDEHVQSKYLLRKVTAQFGN